MGAIIEACNSEISVKNTGVECHTAMSATAMLLLMYPGTSFTKTDLEDPVTFFQDLIQERKCFPLFGNKFPISTIQNNTENDATVTLDDGTQVFLRYGVYNRVFETLKGGLCYAEALQSFLQSGFQIIEIDQNGSMLVHKNNDGTYTGLNTTFMYSPSPTLSDFSTTPYKNRFSISYSPVEMVRYGKILTGADSLLDLAGLLNVVIKEAAAGTTTALTISVTTGCSGANLATLFPTEIVDLDLYVVTNAASGATVTPSGATISNGNIVLAGTFTSGQSYYVVGSNPTIWASNGIEGYDASKSKIKISVA